jgi:hypothetical protein
MTKSLTDLEQEKRSHQQRLKATEQEGRRWRTAFWIDIGLLILIVGFFGLVLLDQNHIPGDVFVSIANQFISFDNTRNEFLVGVVCAFMAFAGPFFFHQAGRAARDAKGIETTISIVDKKITDETNRIEQERREKEQIAREVRAVFAFDGHSLIKGRPDNSKDQVRKVQILLTARGNETAVDGSYGDDTEAKVKAAQTGLKILVDGKVGGDTWHRLVEEAINSGRGRQILDLYRLHQPQAEEPEPPAPST